MGGIARTLFGGGQQEQARDWQEAAQRGMGAYQQAFDPYMQAGQQGLGAWQKALGQMADPQAWVGKMMGGYQQSPWAKFQMQQEEQAARRGAVAGGPTGGAEQKALARYAQGVTSQDMQNYYNNLMGAWQQYLGGERGLAGAGLEAGGQFAPGMAGQWQQWGAGKGAEDWARAQMWRRMFNYPQQQFGRALEAGGGLFAGGGL